MPVENIHGAVIMAIVKAALAERACIQHFHVLKPLIQIGGWLLLGIGVIACGNDKPSHNNTVLDAQAHIQQLQLSNQVSRFTFTPQIGGRGLHFGLVGAGNVLKVDERLLSLPAPNVSASSNNIGYLGHINWVGPQAEWWVHQTENLERRQQKAVWPPDAYTVLANATINTISENAVNMTLPASPVTGLRLDKSYVLHNDGSLQLDVTATNTRLASVEWDIWFNTRLNANSVLYVPIDGDQYARADTLAQTQFEQAIIIEEGLLTIDLTVADRLKGKVFVQPNKGWMAAFTADQLFVIEFALQPQSAIHPSQGQLEFYLDYTANSTDAGLLEMELHSPYTQLAPGESFSSQEIWRVYNYEGPNTALYHRRQLKLLGYK